MLELTQDASAHDWRQTLRQILSGERQAATPRWSGQLIARNGSRYSIAFKLAPILAQRNSDTGVVITLTDLSEIHESRRALADSEQQLRLALEASGMGCFDWDLETGSVTWNRQHEVLWGFQPGETTGAYADFSRRGECRCCWRGGGSTCSACCAAARSGDCERTNRSDPLVRDDA